MADTLTFGEELEVPADLVVLSTAMEPSDVTDLVEMMKLPVGADRFLLEVHPKLRPVELPKGGILLAGTCQAPRDVPDTVAQASGAAAKALSKAEYELQVAQANYDLAVIGVNNGDLLDAGMIEYISSYKNRELKKTLTY